MRYASPLRYPGGKAALTSFLADTIALNELQSCVYYEPYAGGAGAALELLKKGIVDEVYLNDADCRVYAFWLSVLTDCDRFVDRVHTVSLTICEWRRQRDICASPASHSKFDIGFATFFMNRCNRSGVIDGAGPIGGYEQNGEWRLDARFNREMLADRILRLARMKNRIHISCEDAVSFLKRALPGGRGRSRVFVYLDPPYVNKGQRLYLNAYRPEDHAKLASYLSRQSLLPWLVSYDDSSLVRALYAQHCVANMPIKYSLQKKRTARELIITPHYLVTPDLCRTRERLYMATTKEHK